MDTASVTTLTNWLDGVDKWVELAPLLPALVALELVLSADNAVALAAIARNQQSVNQQKIALNIGIFLALIFRICLILMAQFVLQFWPLQLLAGIYLLYLFSTKIIDSNTSHSLTESLDNNNFLLFRTILLIAFTDLAFSIDSVAAAVAISDQFLLVVTGAVIGVIALRFTSGLFISWLEIFPRLEMAGYIAVAFVGVKLLLQLALKGLIASEWLTLSIFVGIFTWGFSTKVSKE